MIKFVVVEDCEQIEKSIQSIICDVMINTGFSFKIFSVHSQKDLTFHIQDGDKKVYILDFQNKSDDAMSIIRKIRERDWESFIIILSTIDPYHYYRCFESQMMIFDYISLLAEDYSKKLYADLMVIVNRESKNSCLMVRHYHTIDYIPFKDILYITIEAGRRGTAIITENSKFRCSMPLRQLEEKLTSKFIKVYRSCIVNIDKVSKVDFKNNLLVLENDEHIWISRHYTKAFREMVSKDCQNIEKII